MNRSISIAKLFALMPVVALAAACNGAAPGSPSSTSSGVSATGSADATTTGAGFAAPQENASCRMISVVNLRKETGDLRVRFQAQYGYRQPTNNPCLVPPSWTASRGDLTVEPDGFHAWTRKVENERTTVTATAPNGVSKSLTF